MKVGGSVLRVELSVAQLLGLANNNSERRGNPAKRDVMQKRRSIRS